MLRQARLRLIDAAGTILRWGLEMLGMTAPERV
jgi:arginyl-tRNA synthetase